MGIRFVANGKQLLVWSNDQSAGPERQVMNAIERARDMRASGHVPSFIDTHYAYLELEEARRSASRDLRTVLGVKLTEESAGYTYPIRERGLVAGHVQFL